MEWPTDGSSLIRALLFLGSSGTAAWIFRRVPRRFGRFLAERWNLEQENFHLKRQNASLKWRYEDLIREVEESRRQAERIDALLDFDGSSAATIPPPAIPLTSGTNAPTPTSDTSGR